MPKSRYKSELARVVLNELGNYMDAEINNRSFGATDEHDTDWSMQSACFRENRDALEILLEDDNGNRRGVAIKLTVDDYQVLPAKGATS
jgi:hypothetical protein